MTNVGSKPWKMENLKLGARVFNRQGIVVGEFRGDSVGPVATSQSVDLNIDLDLTGMPDRELEIVFDLVSEFQFWFEDVGSSVTRVVL